MKLNTKAMGLKAMGLKAMGLKAMGLKAMGLKLWLLLTLGLMTFSLLGADGVRAQTVVAQSSFTGTAGTDLNGTAATTGGTWIKDNNYQNTLLLDGNGGIYNGPTPPSGNGRANGLYKLSGATFPSGSGTVEGDVYVASLINDEGLYFAISDNSGAEHGYQGGFYYASGQVYSTFNCTVTPSAPGDPTNASGFTNSRNDSFFVAGKYYHLRFSVSPGHQLLEISSAQSAPTTNPYTGTYTTVASGTDSSYIANGPIGVFETSYSAGSPSTGFHLMSFQATAARAAVAFYVDPASGSDTNDGLAGTAGNGHGPWQTIAKAAANTYVAGDQLLLKGGAALSGSLTFTGLPPALIGVYGTGAAIVNVPAGQDGVGVTGYGNCTVAGITFTGPSTPSSIVANSTIVSHGVRFTLPSSFSATAKAVAVQNCTITGFDVGISVWAKGNSSAFLGTSITGNIVHDCPGNGIVVRGVEGSGGTPGSVSIAYNAAYNIIGVVGTNAAVDGDTSGTCIISTDQRNSSIDHNVIHDSGSANTNPAGPGGIVCVNFNYSKMRFNEAYNLASGYNDACAFDLDGGCQYSEMAYNYSHNNQGCGYFLCNFAQFANIGNTVHHNISVNDCTGRAGNSSEGNSSFQTSGPNITGFAVYSNTFVQRKAGVPLLSFDDAGTSGAFYNNLLVSKNGGIFFKGLAAYAAGPSQFRFVGNDYYSPDSSALYSKIPGQADQTTLLGFRTLGYETLAGVGQTGLSVSPLWVASALTTPPTLGTYSTYSVSGLRLYDIAPTSGVVGTGIPYALLGIGYSGMGATPPVEDFHGFALQPVPDVGAVTYPTGGYPVSATASKLPIRRLQ